MSGGGGGSTNTVQKSDPWVGVQPYLAGNETIPGLFNEATEWYMGAPLQYYPGQLVADPGDITQQAEAMIRQRASGGSWLEGLAKNAAGSITNLTDPYSQMIAEGRNNDVAQYLRNVMGGSYLNSNPYLSAAMDAANSNTLRQFNSAVMPSIASQFATSGRYGSGAQMQGVSDATNNLATQLSNTNANIANANYQFERGNQAAAAQALTQRQQFENSLLSGRQMGALGMLPGLSQMDYQNLSALTALGAQQDARAQNRINAEMERYNFNRDAPLSKLNAWGNILAGGAGMGGVSQTTGSGPSGSFLSNAIGGGMLANSLYGLGANAGLWGGAAGLSALGGMGLGSGALMGGATGLAATGALGGVSAGTSLFSTAAPLMALML